MKRRMFLTMFLGLAMVGCGESKPIAVTPAPPPPAKSLLEAMASSGEMGSEVDLIKENFEAMKAAEPQKAEELLSDLETLRGMTDPAQIKSQAQKMAAKL